jgi:2'-5' RNA ligase
VIWAGVGRGADALVELAGRVDEALAPLGFQREPRPFSPHVTLGRVRAPRRDPALADALVTGVDHQFGRFSVERVALMRSDLSPRGARYTELDAVRLA